MNPTRTDVHVDPVLTKIAIAYQNADYVAEQIMPVVTVEKKSGIYFEYDRSKFRRLDDIRAPGTRANRADYGLSQQTYGPIVEHALEDDVPDEIADEYPDRLDAYADAVEQVTERIAVGAEASLATLMADTAQITQNTTLSGTSQWNDYANSDPIGDIDAGREVIRGAIFKMPNTLLLSRVVYDKLRHSPDFLERFKYSERGVLSADHMAALFEVDRVLIAGARETTSAEGATETTADLWGKHAWLLFIEPRPRLKAVSFGWTLSMGARSAERWYQQPEKTTFVRVNNKYEQKVVAVSAAYLILNAIA